MDLGTSKLPAAAGKLLLAFLLTVGLYFTATFMAMPITAVLTVNIGAIMIVKNLISSGLFVLAGLGVNCCSSLLLSKNLSSKEPGQAPGFLFYGFLQLR